MELSLAVLLAEPVAFFVGLGVLRVPVAALRARRMVVLGVLGALSAIAAALAGPVPTGWTPLDLLLCAALGAAAVFAGAVAPSGLILLGGVGCALAGMDSAALPLALAAVGLVLVSLVAEAEPLVDGAAAGLVAQAALRLTSPGGRGMTALVAALVLVPMLLAAVTTLERRHRRSLVRVAVGAGAFAFAGAVAGALAAGSAAGVLRNGLSVATAALDAPTAVGLETTADRLADAERDFSEARRWLEAWWARPARVVPVVAQHWRVLRAAALSGEEMASAGQRAIGAPALGNVRVSDGRVPLEQLAAIEAPVADLAARATAARRRLDEARSAWLVPPLFDELDDRLTRVREVERTAQLANRVLPMVPRLLGQGGHRRYLLVVQTPVESRAGGGFIGNFGEIVAEDGRLALTRFGRHDELTDAPGKAERTLKAPPDYVARYERFLPHLQWVNVNLSPDFPTDAEVMANLYPQSGGAPVDGVIAVDPAALAALLSVTGPVEVPSWPAPITADNALQTLLYDQYQDIDARQARVGFLGDVAQAAWRRLTSGDLPPVPQVVTAIGPAVRAKHMFLWSARPDEQRLFEDIGAAGGVPPVDGDYVGVVTQNAAGNKTDYFLRRTVDYHAGLDPGSGRLQATATIALQNDAPSEGLDHGMIGNDLNPRLPTGSNKLYVSFYTPWELVGGTIDGKPVVFESATELGRKVYSVTVVIPPKSTATLGLTLSGRLADSDSYRLDVHRQPMVAPDDVTTTLSLTSGWRTAAGAREQTTRHRLESDVTVEVPLRRR